MSGELYRFEKRLGVWDKSWVFSNGISDRGRCESSVGQMNGALMLEGCSAACLGGLRILSMGKHVQKSNIFPLAMGEALKKPETINPPGFLILCKDSGFDVDHGQRRPIQLHLFLCV